MQKIFCSLKCCVTFVYTIREKMKNTQSTKLDTIRQAIKNSSFKWDKSSYGYAIGAMQNYSAYGIYWNTFKLQELKDEFFRLAVIPENFKRISKFKTFQHLID